MGFIGKGKIILSLFPLASLPQTADYFSILFLAVVGCTGRENIVPSPPTVYYIFLASILFVDVDGGFLFLAVFAEERCGWGFRGEHQIIVPQFSFVLLPQSVDFISITCRGLYGTRKYHSFPATGIILHFFASIFFRVVAGEHGSWVLG